MAINCNVPGSVEGSRSGRHRREIMASREVAILTLFVKLAGCCGLKARVHRHRDGRSIAKIRYWILGGRSVRERSYGMGLVGRVARRPWLQSHLGLAVILPCSSGAPRFLVCGAGDAMDIVNEVFVVETAIEGGVNRPCELRNILPDACRLLVAVGM